MRNKVWGIIARVEDKAAALVDASPVHRQVRAIFCGTQKQFAPLVGETVSSLRGFACLTGNEVELELASHYPGVVLFTHSYQRGPWYRLDTLERVK